MAKAFLSGYIAWVLHTDAVQRAEEIGAMPYRGMHIFIDEINKLFGGSMMMSNNQQGGSSQSIGASENLVRTWPDLWRVWLRGAI